MQGHLILKSAGVSRFAYPGHPLLLGYVIMTVFPSYAEAAAPTKHGFCEALGDSRIPGAGCHVGAAMSALKIGADGGSPDEMVKYANDYWVRGKAGGHTDNVEEGLDQAKIIEPLFLAAAAQWDWSLPHHDP